jgi:hypothetical protein
MKMMAYTIGLFSLLWEKVLIMQSTHIKKKTKTVFELQTIIMEWLLK